MQSETPAIGESRAELAVSDRRIFGRVYYGWFVAGACFLVYLIVSPLITSFSIFYVALLKEFPWSRGQLSLALALHLVLVGIASPFAGHVVDRFGGRRSMLAGSALASVALIAMSQATSLWHFYLAFGVIAALGSSLLQIAPLMAIVSSWFDRHRGTAIGLVACGSGVGHLVILPLVQYLIGRVGWRGAYVALAAAVLTVPTILIWRFISFQPHLVLPEAERRSRHNQVDVLTLAGDGAVEKKHGIVRRNHVVIVDEDWARTDWSISTAVRTLRFWALALVMAMFAAGSFLISSQLVAYLRDKGYGLMFAASVEGLHGVFNSIGKFAGGILSDQIGREKTLTISIGLFLLCLGLLNFAGSAVNSANVVAFAVLYGLSYGMALPALITSASDLFQGQHFGSILGVIVFGAFVGGGVGTWLGGHLFDWTRSYELNFASSAVLMLAAAALIWKARPGRIRLKQTLAADPETVQGGF